MDLWTRLVDEHEADRVALGPVPEQSSRRPLLVGVSGAAAVSVAGVLAGVLSLAGGASNASPKDAKDAKVQRQ